MRSTYATRLSAGGVAAEWVTQLLRQGDSQVFKRYSQMKLQMKREALEKIDRQANEMPLDSGTAMFSEIYLAQLEAPAPCPSSRSKAVTARCAVARPLGPSGVLRQRRRCNADGEVPLIRSLLASLLYAAEVHGFGSCPMSDWIRKSHFKLS